MRIYEGSPRQDWEEVLRSIGAFADRERLKELLLLELEAGFILQGLALPTAGAWAESEGVLTKKMHELPDEEIGQLIDDMEAKRAPKGPPTTPHAEITNFYEQALRVIGAYLDKQPARDIFFFEQEGSFVLRLLMAPSATTTGHQLVEFTKDDILAMIEAAPQQRS